MRTSKQTKIQSWLLVALFGLFAASCGNEEEFFGMNEEDGGGITFTVTPDFGVNTRATAPEIPAGKVLRFIMEVYDSSDNLVVSSRQVETLTADGEVKFSLSKTTKDSKVVFWADYADDADTDWFYDTTTGGLKAISMLSPATPLDGTAFGGEAFYGSATIDENGTPSSTSITLVHAVAQVNFKSTVKLTSMQSVKITYGDADDSNAPMSVFNALDGGVETAAKIDGVINTVDATAASPYGFHTFYLFAPKTSETIINAKVELCSDAAGTTTVTTTEISNIPLRANYRTNIAGDFCNNTFAVSCSPAWGGEWETPISIWDGTPATFNEDYVFGGDALKSGDSEVDAYVISSAADLAQLAVNVNNGMSYQDKYFKLTTNIDLNNHDWTPIGHYFHNGKSSTKPFYGNFDGQQHKITGLYINSDWYYVGLFGYVANAYIENLHVTGNILAKNEEVYDLYNGEAAAAGGICGRCDRISNCSFSGSIDAAVAAGGIVGFMNGGSITACKNSGYIKGLKSAGGITGLLLSTPVRGCYNEGTIEGGEYICGIAGYMTNAGVEATACYNIGKIIAMDSSTPASIAGIGDYNISSCFVKEKFTNSTDGETVFAYGNWPVSSAGWFAAESNNGTDNKYWKSLGYYNNAYPVYPKLWWED